MYCGSCTRDNALARELLVAVTTSRCCPFIRRRGPTNRTSAATRVLFGGISVYLQQYVPLFRRTPGFLDRLWDSPARHRRVCQPRHFHRCAPAGRPDHLDAPRANAACCRRSSTSWLTGSREEPLPEIINLPNSLLIALAAPLASASSDARCAARCRGRSCLSTAWCHHIAIRRLH